MNEFAAGKSKRGLRLHATGAGSSRVTPSCGLAVLALGLVACAQRPVQAPTDFSPRGDLVELERPLTAASACQIETVPPHVDWAEPLPLSLSAAGAPALSVFRVPARIRIAEGATRVLVDDGVLALAAHARLADLELFPRRPLRDAAVVLLPQATLRPVQVSGASLKVQHKLLGPLRPLRDQPLELDVACADLGVSRASYDAAASVGLLGRLGYAYLRGQQVVSLYADAEVETSAPMRVFLAKGDWLELALHSPRSKTDRVLASYRQGAELIVGWLNASALEYKPQVPAPVSYAGGGRFLIPQGTGSRRCRRPLELGVVQGRVSAYVGQLRAGGAWDYATEEEPDLSQPGLVPVRVPHATWLALLSGAQLVARATDLRRCHEPPSAAPTPKK